MSIANRNDMIVHVVAVHYSVYLDAFHVFSNALTERLPEFQAELPHLTARVDLGQPKFLSGFEGFKLLGLAIEDQLKLDPVDVPWLEARTTLD